MNHYYLLTIIPISGFSNIYLRKNYTIDDFIRGCLAGMSIPILPIAGILVAILFMANIIFIDDGIIHRTLANKFANGFAIGIRSTICLITEDDKTKTDSVNKE
jgi:hypothetical protein